MLASVVAFYLMGSNLLYSSCVKTSKSVEEKLREYQAEQNHTQDHYESTLIESQDEENISQNSYPLDRPSKSRRCLARLMTYPTIYVILTGLATSMCG